MRSALVFGGLLLALLVPNVAIVQKERLLANGTTMLLELAPVDPRSLIQGDYMQLDYALARGMLDGGDREERSPVAGGRIVIRTEPPANGVLPARRWPRDGLLVVAVDENGVARFVRRHDGMTALGANEHLLRYRKRRNRIRVATDAFHFQEGHADRYANARYGELRVDNSGASVLIGLRDEERRRLQ